MAVQVTLGVWNKTQLQKIKIENIDLQAKVKQIRGEALKCLNDSSANIDLSFCGIILEDENTLSSYGITSGTTIHVLEKPNYEKAPCEKKLNTLELVSAFRSLIVCSGYRSALQRLFRKEVLDKIIAANPSLVDHPAAMALVQDPELIVHLGNATEGPKIVAQYPVLLEVANSIISHIKAELANTTSNQAGTSTGYSYSLQALSDEDDDDDMDSSSDSTATQHPISRNSSFNAITAAQLAAAIANATNTQFDSASVGVPTAPGGGGGNVITSEMFSSAIQQAFALGGGGNGSSGAAGAAARAEDERPESFEALARLWHVQLQQMHEMGLLNDVKNIRALKLTGGDVNAAIEFILLMS